jgi:[ribosomal protein S18]-alanine N-acetyltransferase
MIIRRMKKNDLPQVMDIEAVSFLSPWNESQFLYELLENPFSHLYVASENDMLIGFIDFWITFDSGCINQIAVLPHLRKKGIASILLQDALTRLTESGVRTVTLEVRTHNQEAIKLYEKFGFASRLVKTAYYDNGDDALYMEKGLIL